MDRSKVTSFYDSSFLKMIAYPPYLPVSFQLFQWGKERHLPNLWCIPVECVLQNDTLFAVVLEKRCKISSSVSDLVLWTSRLINNILTVVQHAFHEPKSERRLNFKRS
ncbi:hypothetical protein OUZ56_001731 [Daphnia magna]|uniref:Uncharacterized protein n=1 Tax=Daphnia magna TaxID=35525 RepID=A0ABR0A3K0_9CRUS|nr:hypothetical protein OUZ56_001731 [Daphnia magna]